MLNLYNGNVVKKILNPSNNGRYNSFQSLIENPNLIIIKDKKALTLIDSKTLSAKTLTESQYDIYSCKNSFF